MLSHMLYAGTFALVMLGAAQAVSAVDAFYDARYRRELYLTAKAKRELMEQAKNPEWEPVEEEPDD